MPEELEDWVADDFEPITTVGELELALRDCQGACLYWVLPYDVVVDALECGSVWFSGDLVVLSGAVEVVPGERYELR